jgi:GT2 family glycosyltransferase
LAVKTRTTVITVSHNSQIVLPKMLKSLPEHSSCIVVDNASDNPQAVAKIARMYGAHFIENANNIGYGPANNVAASKATSEFLFFLNPDAQVNSDTIIHLERAADLHSEVVAFNPVISNPNGRPFLKRRSVLLPKKYWLPRGCIREDKVVPVLSGAAFFVRREAFEDVGGFDPNIFLYHEDDDLSLRLNEKAGGLMIIQASRVMHDAGNSVEKSTKAASSKAYFMGRSRLHVMRKHQISNAPIKALMSATGQLLVPWNISSSRKRRKQLAFLKGVLDELL